MNKVLLAMVALAGGCTHIEYNGQTLPPKPATSLTAAPAADAAGFAEAAAVLQVLGVAVDAPLAKAKAAGKSASDFLYVALVGVPALVVVDWRAFPSEALAELARAAAPLGWTIDAIDEEDEHGWAPFTLTRDGVRQSLRARLNGGGNGDDRSRFMSDLVAHFGDDVTITRVALFDGSDTEGFVVLDGARTTALRAAAGPHFATWFRALQPTGEPLILPART